MAKHLILVNTNPDILKYDNRRWQTYLAPIITVANLLGHANLSHVTKYAKVTDALKIKAVNTLPEIDW